MADEEPEAYMGSSVSVCRAVFVTRGRRIIDLAHRSRHVMNHPLPNPESIKPKPFSSLVRVVHKKGYIYIDNKVLLVVKMVYE
jgi:hypothetical protein